MTAIAWSEAERKAWAPPEKLTVSEHADRYRVLDGRNNSEPGPWRTSRTPYLRAIMDAMGDPDIDLVAAKKPAQVGASEATRNALFYWVRNDPGPCLIVYPDEKSTKENVEERLKPMVLANLSDETTERSHDLKLTKLALTTMDIYAGWAGSPQRLASRPVRYVILDEVNKYSDWTGKDAAPIALAKARTRTWGRRAKIILISTPTVPNGHISKAFDDCERKYYPWVQCPTCSTWQTLSWPRVVWPERMESEDRRAHSARVSAEQLARYSCSGCDEKWDETQRKRAIREVEWRMSEDSAPKGRSVGFQFNVLINAWANMSELAAKFLKVCNSPQDLMEFVNQDLGEDFQDQQSKVDDSKIALKARANHPRFEVPQWAGHVLIGVDSQKAGFWYGVRAFGKDLRSRLIDHGFVESFLDLDHLLKTSYPIQGTAYTIDPAYLLIDAGGGSAAAQDGSKTDQVYRWSMTDPRIKPVLGRDVRDTAGQPIRMTTAKYGPEGKEYSIMRYLLNSDYFKDLLNSWIEDKDDSLWQVHGGIDADYIRQMSSEQKVLKRIGNQMRYKWILKSHGMDNHMFDVECYLAAAATIAQSALLPDETTLMKQRKEFAIEAEKINQELDGGHQPWLGRKRGAWL